MKQSSLEIIRAMKKAGHKYILCKAQSIKNDEWETVVAYGISSYDSPHGSTEYMYDSFDTSYFDFYPIDSKGQKIIGFIDDKIITEATV